MNTDFRTEKYEKLSAEVTRLGGDGKEFVDAVEDLYSAYGTPDVVWLAKLFEPDIGGWYYSNSARDNDGFLPDIESTIQAMNYLKGSGMVRSDLEHPEWMLEKIKEFNLSLFDSEDGYIYHPQWGKKITDSRRGRDLMWSEDLSRRLGYKFSAPTATERLRAAREAEGEKKKESLSAMPEYLRSEEAFREYMNSFDWENKAYWSGNVIAAQGAQIVNAGYKDIAIEILNSHQRADTGIWGTATGYEAINGILKISCFYGTAKSTIPNAINVARTAMDCICSDEKCSTVCYQFNAWYSAWNAIANLRKYGNDKEKAEAEKIYIDLLRTAPEGLRASKRKALTFKKADGSFSYCPGCTCPTSQGAPVTPGLINEGDVNATILCTTGLVGKIFGALELEGFMPPIHGEEQYNAFLENLRKPAKM